MLYIKLELGTYKAMNRGYTEYQDIICKKVWNIYALDSLIELIFSFLLIQPGFETCCLGRPLGQFRLCIWIKK